MEVEFPMNRKIFLLGLLVPFDVNSAERYENFKNILSKIEAFKSDHKNESIVILWDLICDLNWKNRFDKILTRLVKKFTLTDSVSLFDRPQSFTYRTEVPLPRLTKSLKILSSKI